MGSSILDRTRTSNGLEIREREPHSFGEARRGKSVWLLLLFVLVGFGISVGVTLLAGSSPYGVLVVAAVVILAIPLVALIIKAAPQALENARLLRRNWTWWHPLWFFIFFSMEDQRRT